jgi:hypothetical protein
MASGLRLQVVAAEGIISAGRYRPNVNDQPLRYRKTISDVWPVKPIFIGLPVGVGKLTAEDTGGKCFIRLSAPAQDT